jgi:hypothetical protein
VDAGHPELEGPAREQPGSRRRAPRETPNPKEPSAVLSRISRRTAARTRRVVTFLLGLWCGGMLLVALVAPASFTAADSVLKAPPPALETVIEKVDAATAQAVLRYQVAEVNRLMFGLWGWTQGFLAVAVLVLLVFLSNAGRHAVGVAALMVLLAGIMNFVLIPGISTLTRAAASAGEKASAAGSFALLHTGFAVFQAALVVLIAVLLFLLFRGRDRSGEGA